VTAPGLLSLVALCLCIQPTLARGRRPTQSKFGVLSREASPIAVGGSGIANAAVLQQWQGVAPGVARIEATITTSDGQTLIGWSHQPVSQPG
jgi:hypothetical protein